MKHMSDSTRRAFLATLAASGVGATALPSIARADATTASGIGYDASGGSGSAANSTGPRTEAFPAPTIGTNYTYVQGAEFFPLESNTTFTKVAGQIETSANNVSFFASLSDIPPGARITEVTFAVLKSATTPGDASVFIYRVTSDSFLNLDTKFTGGLAQQSTEQYVSLTVTADATWIVDNEQSTHWLVATMFANSRINSARVGWTLDRPSAFIPIDPKRVYDSRFTAPTGPLATNNNRVVSVANSFLPNTGTLDVTDLVPVAAKAIAYNLTITNTLGSGFLSVAPGDATTLGASSINWFQSGMTLANGLVVKLDAGRHIKVFCGGGGSTDFIIDVLGYYV